MSEHEFQILAAGIAIGLVASALLIALLRGK